MNAPNLDYTTPDERMRKMEQSIAVLGEKVGALADGAAEVVEELKAGAARMEEIDRKVDRVIAAVESDPGGLTNHELRIRELERERDRHNGAGWWKPIAVGVTIAVVSALLTFGATKVISSLRTQADRTAALCATKFQMLDESRARNEMTERQHTERTAALVSQGCVR